MSGCEQIRAELDAFLDGELDEARADEVGRHIESCPDCREALAGLRGLSAALRRLPALPAPEGFVERFRQARLAGPAVRPAPRRAVWALGTAAAAAAALLLAAALIPERRSAVDVRPGKAHDRSGPGGGRHAHTDRKPEHGSHRKHAPAPTADEALSRPESVVEDGGFPASPAPAVTASPAAGDKEPARIADAAPAAPAAPRMELPSEAAPPGHVPPGPAPAAPQGAAAGTAAGALQRALAESDAGGELRARTMATGAAGRTQTVYALKVLVGSDREAAGARAGALGFAGGKQEGKAAGIQEAQSLPAAPPRPVLAFAKVKPGAVAVPGISVAEAERRLVSIARSLGGGLGGAETVLSEDRTESVAGDVPSGTPTAGPAGSAAPDAAAGASRTLVLRLPAGQVETFARALAYWGQVSPGARGAKSEASPAGWREVLASGADAAQHKEAEQAGPERAAARTTQAAKAENAPLAPADPADADIVYLTVTIEETVPAAEK